MYEKGSWIVHMLRRRLGDPQFFKLLGEACRRYRNQPLSTEQFRLLAREFLPPRSEDPQFEEFFDHYVYGTGIPTLKLQHSVQGKAPALKLNGTVTLSDADEDFAVMVPVEIQFARAKPVVEWVRVTNEPSKFTVALKQAPARVVLAPGEAVLARK
jgi:aminopeptidase N